MEDMKTCIKCGIRKPNTNEYFAIRSRGGLISSCKKCRSKYDKERSTEASREESNKRCKIWYYANHEKCLKVSNDSYHANSVEKNIVNRKWYKDNPEKSALITQRRNAKKKSLPCTLTNDQWDDIKKVFNNKCAYCGEETHLTREHFVALSKGGEFSRDNIIPVCKTCNCSKNDKDFFIWYPKFKHYSLEREIKILSHLGYKNGVQQLTLV